MSSVKGYRDIVRSRAHDYLARAGGSQVDALQALIRDWGKCQKQSITEAWVVCDIFNEVCVMSGLLSIGDRNVPPPRNLEAARVSIVWPD